MALGYEQQALTGSDWTSSLVALGKVRVIDKIMFNNGATSGSVLIELFDNANTLYYKIAELTIPAYPVAIMDYVQWYDPFFLLEDYGIKFTPTGSSDIVVHIFYSEK